MLRGETELANGETRRLAERLAVFVKATQWQLCVNSQVDSTQKLSL